jgi:acyl-CoA synthetase (AMP-forming)/AMP-acid ligase II
VEYARVRPEAAYIIEAETGRALTSAHTLAAVRSIQRLLGAAPRRIVLVAPNGIVMAVLWLAALAGGHTLLPIAVDAPPAERRRLARRFSADLLVLEHTSDADAFASGHVQVLTCTACERAIATAPRDHERWLPAPAEGRVCLTTSGSTGEPKGVLLSARQVAWTAHHIAQAHQLGPEDRGLTVLPFTHVNAPVVSLCAALSAGGAVVIAEHFSRTRFWPWVERYEVTWASAVPTILAMLLQTEKPTFLPGKLRFVRTASAPLPVVHLHAFERRFGIPVVETYGLSEAAATVATNPAPPGRRKPGSVGRPLGVAMRVCRPTGPEGDIGQVRESLEDVRPGEVGEICVCGPGVIRGYLGDQEPGVFVDGWLRTGDLGAFDEDGYLYIKGRLRETILRGGENIAPREVEEVLLAAPDVRDAATIGLPDPIYGQRVVAYVVSAGRWSDTAAEALRDHCAAHLSPHKVPDTFIPVAALPRTRSGKLQRHLLRDETLAQRLALADASVSVGSVGRRPGDVHRFV